MRYSGEIDQIDRMANIVNTLGWSTDIFVSISTLFVAMSRDSLLFLLLKNVSSMLFPSDATVSELIFRGLCLLYSRGDCRVAQFLLLALYEKHMDMDIEIFGGGAGSTTAHILMFSRGEKRSHLRTHLMRALSPRAVALQEPILQHYAHAFVGTIRARLRGELGVVDIAHWFSIITVDILSDLVFGASFSGVESGVLHPWIKLVFKIFKFGPLLRVFREVPGVKSVPTGIKSLFLLLPQWLSRKFMAHLRYGSDLVEERLASPQDRLDFTHFFTAEPGMSRDEMKENAVMLVTAGSEPVCAPC